LASRKKRCGGERSIHEGVDGEDRDVFGEAGHVFEELARENFKCPWPPLIRTDEAVLQTTNALFNNVSDQSGRLR